jgi:hypothetical protein
VYSVAVGFIGSNGVLRSGHLIGGRSGLSHSLLVVCILPTSS